MVWQLTWLLVDQCGNRTDAHCRKAEFFPPCFFSFLAGLSKDLIKCFLLKRKKKTKRKFLSQYSESNKVITLILVLVSLRFGIGGVV